MVSTHFLHIPTVFPLFSTPFPLYSHCIPTVFPLYIYSLFYCVYTVYVLRQSIYSTFLDAITVQGLSHRKTPLGGLLCLIMCLNTLFIFLYL